MDFADSEEGIRFWSSSVERRTAEALLYAIALHSKTLEEAETIWSGGVIPAYGAQQSDVALYCTATRNFPVAAPELIWRGDASWAVRAKGRLLANVPAARWPEGATITRETILDQPGKRIIRENGSLVLERRVEGRLYRTLLSEEQGEMTMGSEQVARRIITIDCVGIASLADFWQRYTDAIGPKNAEAFGRNLDAFGMPSRAAGRDRRARHGWCSNTPPH